MLALTLPPPVPPKFARCPSTMDLSLWLNFFLLLSVFRLSSTVVASPSREAPDYYYSWTRDSALAIKVLVDRYGDELASGHPAPFAGYQMRMHTQGQQVLAASHESGLSGHLAMPLRTLLENWALSEKIHQVKAASVPAGQGEPKFYAGDGGVYMGPWGRPQTDGPALRASVLMQFARLIGLSDPFTKQHLYHSSLDGASLIKNDLEYVAHHWSKPTFDCTCTPYT